MANKQAAIGAFVLGGFGLALCALVAFGNFHIFSKTRQAVVVFQDSITGLSVGAPVTFRGVRVGSVRSIGLEFDEARHVALIPVSVDLDAGKVRLTNSNGATQLNLENVIKLGLRAELNLQSFVTGQSEIDLDFDANSPAILHPQITSGLEIPTKQSTIQKVKATLSELPLKELANNADSALQSIRNLTEKLDRDLPPLVESLRKTSDTSQTTLLAATAAIDDLQAKLDTTLTSINKLANTGNDQLRDRGADLHTLLTDADKTVQSAHGTLDQLRMVASPRSSERANIDSSLNDLAAAAASLRSFANDVEHNPQLLLTGRHP